MMKALPTHRQPPSPSSFYIDHDGSASRKGS